MRPIKVQPVQNWTELARILVALQPKAGWGARGEAKKYTAISPLIDRNTLRWKKRNWRGRLAIEHISWIRFLDTAHLMQTSDDERYIGTLLDDPLTALLVMRHCGGPTRLVDWTDSLWIAAYFACCDEPTEAGYLYYFDKYLFTDNVGKAYGTETTEVLKPHPRYIAEFLDPTLVLKRHNWAMCYLLQGRRFPRLHAQKGFCTFASKPYLDHWEMIAQAMALDGPQNRIGVIRISSQAKAQILHELAIMGITASTVFFGLDGLGKALASFARSAHWDIGVDRWIKSLPKVRKR